MFKLLYKSKSRSTPDFAQMLILCAIALLIGLAVLARDGLVIIVQIFVDTFHDPVSNIVYILIPIIAILLVFGSFAAFHSRNRWWGLLIFFGSAYIFWFADQYLRNRVWSEPPQIGAAILFASTFFLLAIGIIYLIKPGKRPSRIFWLQPEPLANRLIRVSAVLFTGSIICVQNNIRVIGYILIFTSVICSYLVWRNVNTS